MAELNFTVPLAKFESEEWLDSSDFSNSNYKITNKNKEFNIGKFVYHSNSVKHSKDNINASDNFLDTFSLSLEDLVNSFDEKVTKCCKDFKENAGNIAPIQFRSEDQISECPTWWTLTGNFGSLLPIDWDKTIAKKLYGPAASLNTTICKNGSENECECHSSGTSGDEGDDITGNNHSMTQNQSSQNKQLTIRCDGNGLHSSRRDSSFVPSTEFESLPIETAEEVIKEINRILKDSPSASQDSGVTPEISSPSTYTFDSDGVNNSFCLDPYPPFTHDDLVTYNGEKLVELKRNAEQCIEEQSQQLIRELNLRDGWGYEKEVKNTFISLLHSIQAKKRTLGSCTFTGDAMANTKNGTTPVTTCVADNDNHNSNIHSPIPLSLMGKLTNLIHNQNGHQPIPDCRATLLMPTPTLYTETQAQSAAATAISPGSVMSSTISSSTSISSSSSMTNFADESSQRSSSTYLSGAAVRKLSQGSQLASPSSQYLTTVIPYNLGKGAPDIATLQILIKILTAINNGDDQVPNLLTDYILKVICPSEIKCRQ